MARETDADAVRHNRCQEAEVGLAAAGARLRKDYPRPLVADKAARERAPAAWAQIRGG
jgi:deoxyribodipyrimidine photolyase